jgi:cell division protein FtsB
MSSLLRHLGIFAAAALACFYVVVLWKGPQGIPAMLRVREEVIEMEQQNRVLKEQIERRKQHIKALENDPVERERAVREGTNLAKPDETTVFLPGETPTTK